jgi:hypothetical protein
MLCFTEYWLKEEHIGLMNIDHFKLVNTFSGSSSEHGGSCIYVKEYCNVLRDGEPPHQQ